MELDIIQLITTWNDAAGSINTNFSKIQMAIASLEGGSGGIDEGQLATYLSANNYVNSVATLTRVLGYTPVNPVTLDKYLLLSGGTISGVGADLLRINRTDSNPYIAFSNNGTHLGRIGYRSSGPIVHHGSAIYDILHSGNYSSYALPLTGGTISGNLAINSILTINGSESNAIRSVQNPNSSITNMPNYNLVAIRHAIGFKWYDTEWQIGNIRGSGQGSAGFGITKNSDTCVFRVDESGAKVNENTVLHSGNYATVIGDYYLKSTGGKITGPLTIETGTDTKLIFNNTDGEKYTKISFREAGTEYGSLTYSSIGIDLRGAGDLVVNGYPVITNANGIRKVAISAEPTESTYGLWQNQGAYLSVYHSANYNFAFRANVGGLQAKWQTGSSYGASWKTIAFTDSNVASATKLEDNTAFSAWGQTFFENGKPKGVSGHFYLSNNKSIYGYNTSGVARNLIHLDGSNNFIIGSGTSTSGYRTYLEGNDIYFRYSTSRIVGLILNASGNVTIGASDLARSNRKLFINGSASFVIGTQNNITTSDELDLTKTFTITAQNTESNYGLHAWINTSGCVNLQSSYAALAANKNVYSIALNPLGGNVLIGTTQVLDSTSKLHVNGGMRLPHITIDMSNNIYSDNGLWIQPHGDGEVNINYIGTNTIINQGLGRVGIGTTAPQYKLDVAGTGRFTGAVTMSSTLTVGGDVTPSAEGTYNLGSSDTRWKNLYCNLVYATGLDADSLYIYNSIYSEGDIYSEVSLTTDGDVRALGFLKTSSGIKIGDATITWDAANGVLKIDKPIMAKGYAAGATATAN